MTINFSQGEGAPADLVAFSEHLFLVAAEDLKQAVLSTGQAPTGEGKTVNAALKELRAAFHTVMEERKRLENYRRQAGAGAGEPELDLHAARDEIGRRLALLRNAGDR